jgi:hypothetical protein
MSRKTILVGMQLGGEAKNIRVPRICYRPKLTCRWYCIMYLFLLVVKYSDRHIFFCTFRSIAGKVRYKS